MYHHCGANQDSAQHTLEDCPAWDAQRRVLVQAIGGDLSLSAVVKAMVDSERSWSAMVSFCENVILRKEAAERDRELDLAADPARRVRGESGEERMLVSPDRTSPLWGLQVF